MKPVMVPPLSLHLLPPEQRGRTRTDVFSLVGRVRATRQQPALIIGLLCESALSGAAGCVGSAWGPTF